MSSVEALTQFKNEHDGPLKLHVPLGERRRKSFLWSKKITCEEAFQNLLKSSLSFVYAYEGSNEEKNGETAEGRFYPRRHTTSYRIKTKLCVYRDSEIWGNTISGGRRGGNPSEYLGHAWLDFNTKLQKYTLYA